MIPPHQLMCYRKPTLYINLNVPWEIVSPTEKIIYVGPTTTLSQWLSFHLNNASKHITTACLSTLAI